MKVLQSEGLLLRQFKAEFDKASKFYLCMALVTKSGLDLIDSSITQCLKKGGAGYVLFGLDLPTEPAAIEKLMRLEAQHRQKFQLRRFQSGTKFFHPKLSVFIDKNHKKTAILGSSNLTGGGLNGNHEANLLITEGAVVQQLLDYVEEHFEGAHSKLVDSSWLAEYQQLWVQRKQVEQHQRRLRENTRKLGKPPLNLPSKIRDNTFAFTGKIEDWPRKRLYPFVQRHKGHVANKAESMALANCLVQGEILGGRKSTKKLLKARERRIPIITEEQFRKLAGIKA